MENEIKTVLRLFRKNVLLFSKQLWAKYVAWIHRKFQSKNTKERSTWQKYEYNIKMGLQGIVSV
jgi:hypothetical protein